MPPRKGRYAVKGKAKASPKRKKEDIVVQEISDEEVSKNVYVPTTPRSKGKQTGRKQVRSASEDEAETYRQITPRSKGKQTGRKQVRSASEDEAETYRQTTPRSKGKQTGRKQVCSASEDEAETYRQTTPRSKNKPTGRKHVPSPSEDDTGRKKNSNLKTTPHRGRPPIKAGLKNRSPSRSESSDVSRQSSPTLRRSPRSPTPPSPLPTPTGTKKSSTFRTHRRSPPNLPKSTHSHVRDYEEEDEPDSPDPLTKLASRSPGTIRKWPISKEQSLVVMWEEEPHLYDHTDPDYRMPYKRQATIERFAANLNLSAEDVETHMKSMRTAYSKVAMIPTGSSSDRLTHRQKELRRMCYFLKSHIKPKEGLTNLPRSTRESPPRLTKDQAAASTSYARDDQFVQPPSKKRLIDQDSICSFSTTDSPSRTKKPKRQEAPEIHMIGDISKSFSTMATAVAQRGAHTKQDSQETEDRHSLWARILAIKLREAPPYAAERFKIEVDTMALGLIKNHDNDDNDED